MNTSVGYDSGTAVTSGTRNTFVGAYCGDATDDGAQCVAVGAEALSANCGNNNVAVGDTAGIAITGYGNTVMGQGAATAIDAGLNNTVVGQAAGNNLTTGDNCVLVGQGSVFSAVGVDKEFVFGSGVTGSGTNTITIGSASGKISSTVTGTPNWSHSSDERLKKNIKDVTLGLTFINDLRPVTYNWKGNHELNSSDKELEHLYKENAEDNVFDTTSTQWGFVAQEIKTALDTANVKDWDGWSKDEHGVQRLAHTALLEPLVKAVQELSAKVTTLEAEVTKLKGE